jgi:TetR/AcrR family transcriptional regulator, transcriptional repressor of bet genes
MAKTQAKRSGTAPARSTRRRTAAKEVRRAQLIKATLTAVAKKGFAETTMADVAREARLSQGIINLHFRSKDNLLEETLRHLAAEYKQAWESTLERAGPAAADRLAALVDLDFERVVCERNKLAVWFAFWGEAKSRPTYRKLCAERDREYDRVMLALCQVVIDDGGYDIDASDVTHGLSAMSSGLWLDMLMGPDSMTPDKARRICRAFLATVFPKHYQAPEN